MEYHHILSFKVAKLHILRDIEFAYRGYSLHIGRLFSTIGLRPFLESPLRYPSIILQHIEFQIKASNKKVLRMPNIVFKCLSIIDDDS